MIKKRFMNPGKYAQKAPNAHCNSDNVPVISKKRVQLKKVIKENKLKLEANLLISDHEIRSKYNIAVENRFETLYTSENVHFLWKNMQNSIIEAAYEKAPSKQNESKQTVDDKRNTRTYGNQEEL